MRASVVPAVLLAVLVCTQTAQAQPRVSDQALTRALSADPYDVPALIQGLVDLRTSFVVSGAQLKRCIDAAGLLDDPFLEGLLSNASGVAVDQGKIKISFSEQTHLPMKDGGETLGWLHLKKAVTFEVEDDGKQLSTIRGLSVSKSKNGIRGELLGLKISPTTITVRAGKWAVPLFSKTFVVAPQPASSGMAGRVGNG